MSEIKLVPPQPDPKDTAQQPWYQGHQGATNATRSEVQRRCRMLVEDPDYLKRVKRDLVLGTLPTPIEQMLWHYAYGKPAEQINMNVSHVDLSSLTLEELQEQARQLSRDLEEAEALNNAIPAEYKVA